MSHISRRTWLKGLGLFSVVAGNALMLVSTAAEAKASKAAITTATPLKGFVPHVQVLHRERRRGGMGGMCMDGGSLMGMMGAGACQVVEGRISPMGWCDLYAPA